MEKSLFDTENTENVTLQCTVTKEIYRRPANGYTVLLCWDLDRNKAVSVIGTLPVPLRRDGTVYTFVGKFTKHEKYGKQLNLLYYEEHFPVTIDGIEKFLYSSFIKGVGKALAKRIVSRFGEKTLEVIDKEPERLLDIQGIGKIKLQKIVATWGEQREVKRILAFLMDNEITDNLAMKIFRKYGVNSVALIKENPYRLAEEIEGVGFHRADEIAKRLGFPHNSFFRIKAGIMCTLDIECKNGHCYLPKRELIDMASELLAVEDSLVLMTLDELKRDDADKKADIVMEDASVFSSAYGEVVYPAYYYYAEKGVMSALRRVMFSPSRFSDADGVVLSENDFKEKYQSVIEYGYADEQWHAIYNARYRKVMVITGGPGTGKTTTVGGIIDVYKSLSARILLAAPTGRAAKRMQEATGMEAKTIHRLLEYNPEQGFGRNADIPLGGDVLIVDECSMIDILLMNNLMKAVPSNMTVIFVGDADQLPSVGAGNVLHDLIASDVFPVAHLNKVFRQAEESRIITVAHNVNDGVMPDLHIVSKSDFFFLDLDKELDKQGVLPYDRTPSLYAEVAGDMVVDLALRRLPAIGYNPNDIQVLTPQKGTLAGTVILNRILQASLNHNEDSLSFGKDNIFKVDDRVMQIKNNYDKVVFNGDVGKVVSVDTEEKRLTVSFDGIVEPVVYEREELDELALAYASTIHKSQGCEYPVVVMPLITSFWNMLHRNLLYTGITRAKEKLVIVGMRKALQKAVRDNDVMGRNTLLAERLKTIKEESLAYAG